MADLSAEKQDILLESGTNELEIIEFQLQRQLPDGKTKTTHYGINVAKVREIINVPEATEYPNAHPSVMGIFSLRDRLIPLVDLGEWLKVPVDEDLKDKRVIVTEFNRMLNGFLVDSVSRIYRLSWENVESPNQFLESRESDCVVAVVRMENRLIMILDFERIIADINPEQSMERYDVLQDKKIVHDEHMMARRQSKTILIVDDSAFVRKLIDTTLRTAGYNVIACHDGAEAHDMLMEFEQTAKAEGQPIGEMVNLLVSDVEMPRMDGMHLLNRLRKHEVYATLPILMFSSIMSEENRRKALELGANDTVTKPDIGKLVAIVDSHIFNDANSHEP
ncbi:chemotaxis protein CheV [Desulfurispira natronophila]|uniref:Two-component system chemotaxis response regulator CheV n=1 Tax=Desulfurispira natronophila TaxID=682562 RepID=A0A7W7Y3D0_9BACT|nr:chemotaxis protein [Desulfurispira natronophila]MBB5021336.1 two-component system chemotaxis response regulator CheV [Desulfurispira natronophila]